MVTLGKCRGKCTPERRNPLRNELLASPTNAYSHVQQKNHFTPETSSTLQKVPLLGKRCCWDAELPPVPQKLTVTYNFMETNAGTIYPNPSYFLPNARAI